MKYILSIIQWIGNNPRITEEIWQYDDEIQCFLSGPGSQVDWEEGQAGPATTGNKDWDWDTAENARTRERMKKMKDRL